jgi:hypothetical protein
MSCVRKRYREQGFSRKTVGVLMASWISSSKNNTRLSLKDGFSTVITGKLVFVFLLHNLQSLFLAVFNEL